MSIIGSGAHGVVTRESAGVVFKTVGSYEDYVRETDILRRVHGLPCIVEVLSTCAVMRTIRMKDGGQGLFDARHRFGQHRWPEAHFQIVSAVTHLHERNIMHGDIKLENLLVDEEGTIRLCDFGHSRYLTDEECNTATLSAARGSPAYSCPEIMNGERYNGFDADVWAVGVVLYTLAFGYFPFPKAKQGVAPYDTFVHCVMRADMEPTEALVDIWSHKIPHMKMTATLSLAQNLDQLLHPQPSQRIHFGVVCV